LDNVTEEQGEVEGDGEARGDSELQEDEEEEPLGLEFKDEVRWDDGEVDEERQREKVKELVREER
jgi:hypothetical protein